MGKPDSQHGNNELEVLEALLVAEGKTRTSTQPVSKTEIKLERLNLTVQTAVSERLLDSFATPAELEKFGNQLAEQFVFQVRQSVFAQGLQRYEVNFAATWQDAVKERWLPLWMKNLVNAPRCPRFLKHWVSVRKTQIVMDAKALYPSIPVTGHQPYIHIHQQTSTRYPYVKTGE